MTYIVAATALALVIFAHVAKKRATPPDVVGSFLRKESLVDINHRLSKQGVNPHEVEETFNL